MQGLYIADWSYSLELWLEVNGVWAISGKYTKLSGEIKLISKSQYVMSEIRMRHYKSVLNLKCLKISWNVYKANRNLDFFLAMYRATSLITKEKFGQAAMKVKGLVAVIFTKTSFLLFSFKYITCCLSKILQISCFWRISVLTPSLELPNLTRGVLTC